MRASASTIAPPFALAALLLAGCGEEFRESEPQKISIEGGMDFYFYASVPVSEPQDVERYKNLFVFQHGGSLDGDVHFDVAIKALRDASLIQNTIVLAPNFQDSNTRDNYYWTKFSWKDGTKSINGVPKISSYAIYDTLLIDHVLASYDQIETVVLSGHSAGGQLIYKYAALTNLPDEVDQEVIYLPMNPSTVVFLNPERWNPLRERFEIPLNAPSCPRYDEWTYGISDLSTNGYNRNLTPDEVRATFPSRRLVLATGNRDLGGDKACADIYQGANRHERALNVANHVRTFYPSTRHEQIVVPGVAHSRVDMLNSPEIIEFLTRVFE